MGKNEELTLGEKVERLIQSNNGSPYVFLNPAACQIVSYKAIMKVILKENKIAGYCSEACDIIDCVYHPDEQDLISTTLGATLIDGLIAIPKSVLCCSDRITYADFEAVLGNVSKYMVKNLCEKELTVGFERVVRIMHKILDQNCTFPDCQEKHCAYYPGNGIIKIIRERSMNFGPNKITVT